jgi:hypothetical protein
MSMQKQMRALRLAKKQSPLALSNRNRIEASFSSILALKLAFFRSVKSGSPSAVNNPFLSFAIRDKKPQDRVAP